MDHPPKSGPVKKKRRYDSSRRRAQAAQTRREIVTAALEVFLEHGYSSGTMQQIADTAGVVVETIYRGFDGKAALFRAAVEAAVSGGAERAERPVEERPAIRAIIEERDPRRKVERYADTQPGIHTRLGPLYRVLAQAAAVDPELEPLRRDLEHDRLEGMARFAGHLAASDALRPGVTVEEARDVVWTLASHQVYEMLVVQRGWTVDRYRDWLAQMLAAALVGDTDRGGRGRRGR